MNFITFLSFLFILNTFFSLTWKFISSKISYNFTKKSTKIMEYYSYHTVTLQKYEVIADDTRAQRKKLVFIYFSNNLPYEYDFSIIPTKYFPR